MRTLTTLLVLTLMSALAACPVEPEPEAEGGWCGVAQAERPACEGALPERFDSSATVDKGCYLAPKTPILGHGVTLTLAPGVTILFPTEARLDIGEDQVLVASGSADEPICLSGQSTQRGAWDGVRFSLTAAPSVLDHVVVEYGGDTAHDADAAGIKAIADSRGVRLNMTHTTVRESEGWGLFAVGSAVLAGFSGNTLTANTLGPAKVGSMAVQQLLPDSDYTGNDVDRLAVHADYVADGAVWQDLGVPYALDAVLEASGPWTLEPGVTLIMLVDTGHIAVAGNQAALTAVGTAQKPIVFTADPASKASWQGLVFDTTESMAHVLDYVTVEYAGQLPGLYAGAITTHSDSRPIHLTVTHSTIQHNAGYGIWLCGSTQANADIESSNSFADNDLGDYLHQ